jgi:aldose 1-epimerase
VIRTFRLKNSSGFQIDFLNYGGIITRVVYPDGADVTLGFDRAENYLESNPAYFGALIGRFANRMAGAKFQIGDRKFSLFDNDGGNSLHGGKRGFDKVNWNVEELEPQRMYKLTYVSRDGEEGYPGNLSVAVTYSLNNLSEFLIEYQATTDANTVLNLTSHPYFNLSGVQGSQALDHILTVNAREFTESNEKYIPTGKVLAARDEFDFQKPKPIGRDIERVHEGYNQNYILNRSGIDQVAAVLEHPGSKRRLEVRTTEPGLQFYSGYFLEGIHGKRGCTYPRFAGMALEAQHFPDSPNQPSFPSTLLEPGKAYRQTTIYKFF